MFGTRITAVFQSRWKAVTWSLGILATAYCSVPAPDDVAPAPAPTAAAHQSPWAKSR